MRNKSIRICLPFLIISLCMGYALGGDLTQNEAVDIFFQANKEYQAAQIEIAAKREKEALEKFDNAVQLYNQLIESGFENGQIYYNLGNSYYRQGMPGKAIVAYRKAEKTLPRKADIKANIDLLKDDFKDKESLFRLPEFLKTLCFWYFFLNLNEITILTIYIYLGFMTSILLLIFFQFRWLKNMSTIFAICLFVLVVSLGIKIYCEYSFEKGVVIAEECKIRYGPGEEYEPKFEIHEGAEVRIEEQRKGWYKVYAYVDIKDDGNEKEKKDSEFKKGWVAKSKIGKI
ncbi:MAG: tetratricopeptide repeat protein [Candidatus Scalindua sp.]|nr:tetratricopeptide repeat protein [Candidatus Scalindua sp.]